MNNWAKTHPEKMREYRRRCKVRNPEKHKAAQKAYKQSLRTGRYCPRAEAASRGEKYYVGGRPCPHGHNLRYTKSGACVECSKQRQKHMDRDLLNARNAAQRARRLQAKPKWLTKEQLTAIAEYYRSARRLSGVRQFDVDHIIPLVGKTVCGLHVPWNLRVLDVCLNRSRPKRWKPYVATF